MSVRGRIVPFPQQSDGQSGTKRCFRLEICFTFLLYVLELLIIVALCVLIKNVKEEMSAQTACSNVSSLSHKTFTVYFTAVLK